MIDWIAKLLQKIMDQGMIPVRDGKAMQERLGAEVMDARAPKPRRAFVRVSRGAFSEAVRHAVFDLGFSHLMAITAAEAGEEMEALYHMACMGATVLTLSVRVPKGDACSRYTGVCQTRD
jgi:hypothetical protein